jgi:hypothetical protein
MTEQEARRFGSAADALERAAVNAKACKAKDRFKANAQLRIARKNLTSTVNALIIDAYTEGSERALEG